MENIGLFSVYNSNSLPRVPRYKTRRLRLKYQTHRVCNYMKTRAIEDFKDIFKFIIKFPYNAHSDWLKQRALSENRERVDDGKLAFKILLRNFVKFDPY